jgi:hypothetical protein
MQAGVRYATKNPYSYVHANLGGQVALFEVAKVTGLARLANS